MAKKTAKKQTKKKKTKKKVQSKKIQKSKNEKKLFSWYLPFLILLILFLSFTSFLYFLFSKNYKEWEEEFQTSEIEMLDYGDEKVDLDAKILEYNNTESEIAFIEFTKKESLLLFSQALDESLPNWIEIEKTALETSMGNWRFFVKSKTSRFSLPWFEISLSKEGFQSVNVYIEDMFLGDLSLRNIGLNSVVENSNRGLSRAIQLVNDGNFAGRVFENIELAEHSLIIRSREISSF
jgi:hypothetical protein